MQQVLRDGDVDQSGVDIPMTEVGREERQSILRIDPQAVPFKVRFTTIECRRS
jgi:hypothetical protein